MKTRASRHEDDKDKKKRLSKKEDVNNGSYVRRVVASLSQDQIQRMLDTNRNIISKKNIDPTGRAIFNKIQMKMEISQPHDQAEVQADKVAEGVMKGDVNFSKTSLAQNTGSEISAKGEAGMMQTTDGFDQQLAGTKGQGQKLDVDSKAELEQHTGTDLSGVNVHTNSKASELSESINAKAFTHGQDIYFKQGQYNPTSNEGKSLLAHEVTHTVQQGEGAQRKIQRQPTATTRIKDMGPMPHAEGIFHGDKGEGGYIIVPATFPITKKYYDAHPTEKNKMLSDHPGTKLLFNTFYSLAERFMIDLDELIKANKGVTPENIDAGKKIIIPYAPMKMQMIPMKPFQLIPVNIPVPQMKLIPKEQMYGPVVEVKDPQGYANFKEKQNPTPADVKAAANAILKDNPRIKSVIMFLGKIKTQNPSGTWQDWETELEKFLTGPYTPDLTIGPDETTGGTPKKNAKSSELHQPMHLNELNSFSVHVATYLHELNHYIDMWYSSPVAKNLGIQRPGSEFGKGIKPVSVNQKITTTDRNGNPIEAILNDPTESDQVEALPEYITALAEQILRDMQEPTPQPNEHWLVPDLRAELAAKPKRESLDEFIAEKRADIYDIGIGLYGKKKEWHLQNNNGLTAEGVEQGYAFEKAAYGFTELAGQQNVPISKWAGNFNSNFEKMFWQYLQ
ncbi:MAG: eCIS core domain-containing protein [Bacteroidia bacterium]